MKVKKNKIYRNIKDASKFERSQTPSFNAFN